MCRPDSLGRRLKRPNPRSGRSALEGRRHEGEAALEPHRSEPFLHAVLPQALCERLEVDAVERLVLGSREDTLAT